MRRERGLKKVVLAAVAAGVLICGITGCAGEEPEPEPTLLTFASEEEAYAAAEEVYRAYGLASDALAQGDDTADPYQYLIGKAYESELNARRSLDEMNLRLDGESEVGDFNGLSAGIDRVDVVIQAEVCLNSTNARVIDRDGYDVTPDDREDVSTLLVTFISDGDTLRISESAYLGPGQC